MLSNTQPFNICVPLRYVVKCLKVEEDVLIELIGYDASGMETWRAEERELFDVKEALGNGIVRYDVVRIEIWKKPICPNCGEGRLEPHNRAGQRQYKDYPNLLICEKCWHKYMPTPEGKLLYVKNPAKKVKK